MSAELERRIRAARCVIVSPLRRAIESARLLAPSVDPVVDAHFAEPPLPSAIASPVRLPPTLWTGMARAAWFCGWSAGVESFAAARARAGEAARILIARAESHGNVALIGHALLNILIAGRLRALGWKGPRFLAPRHWAFGVYVQ